MNNRPAGGDRGAAGRAGDEIGLPQYTPTTRAPQRERDLRPIDVTDVSASASAPRAHSTESQAQAIAAIWRGTIPLQGTDADTAYLPSRGLAAGHLGPYCRFHAGLKFDGAMLPAIVAGITRADCDDPRRVVALHRTFLQPATGKRLERRMLGPCAGGAVRLGNGSGPLVLGEGLETTASFAKLREFPRAWACLSAPGLAAVVLPPVESAPEIVIAADCDTAGLAAAGKLAERAEAEGRKVYLEVPRNWRKDFNDLLGRGGER